MGLARDLVVFADRLEKDGEALFGPNWRKALAAAPDFPSLEARINATSGLGPADVVRLCAQALCIQRANTQPHLNDAELVATLPSGAGAVARGTMQVMREMLSECHQEAIILGYLFADFEVVKLLADAVGRGADVVLVVDRASGAETALERWPREIARPRIYLDRPGMSGATYGSMHAKCVLVDRHDLLVTSANMTYHGLHGNVEMGIRLRGVAASKARDVFQYLVTNKLVEPA